jgi:fido (protein-threonine AMPylation protein)
MADDADLDAFFACPDFSVSTVSQECLEGDDDIQKTWNSCMDIKIFGKLTMLARMEEARYGLAKQRFIGLTRMREKYDIKWPYFFLALAEVHFLLSDLHGCRDLLDELNIVLHGNEEVIQLINKVSLLLVRDALEDDQFHLQSEAKEAGARVATFSSPQECPIIATDSSALDIVFNAWQTMQQNEEDALVQFQRYACITSNILEGVFSLEGQSWPRLVRRGFFMNSIDGISLTSKQRKKRVIIQILKNTLESLGLLSKCLDDFTVFSPRFVKEIHCNMLKHDCFHEEELEDFNGRPYSLVMLIPAGRYRQVACVTEHEEGMEITQYCNHSDISDEMTRYCTLAREVLCNEEIDVFMKVAWLQWAFLRIHPFADGNGRVARIISSIPLCKLKLPPVAVTQANKKEYFQSLHIADTENNLNPLALFLRESIEKAMREISDLPHAADLGTDSDAGKTKTRRGEAISSSSDEDSK